MENNSKLFASGLVSVVLLVPVFPPHVSASPLCRSPLPLCPLYVDTNPPSPACHITRTSKRGIYVIPPRHCKCPLRQLSPFLC
jgi:hypothetical protein